jgi:hypothetical protein
MKQKWRIRKKWKPVTVEEIRAILKNINPHAEELEAQNRTADNKKKEEP